MTLKRKILVLISLLTSLIILSMSWAYYAIFTRQVEVYSHKQISQAFGMVFDDFDTKMQDLSAKATRFSRSSLTSSLYLLQLYQEQYSELENWTVKEVRKLMTYSSSITNETRKFGELIGASEIIVYDENSTLLAFYHQQKEQDIAGAYFPKVFEQDFIPIKADDS